MASFLNYVIIFALGGGCVYFFTKKEPSSKHKTNKELSQLQLNNDLLGVDKLTLQTRNSDLRKIISDNQRNIKKLRKSDIELKEDFRVMISHQITILELLSNVTGIKEKADINDQIGITKRFAQKYNLYLGSNQALSEQPINNSDIYKSD